MEKFLFNHSIKAKEVRVISESGEQLGIMSTEKAIELAKSKGLDLVQVTEKVEPPVCKIIEYGKFLYNQQKKQRKIKQKGGKLKEIRIGFNTSEGDLETKAKQIEKFLKEGNKVKVSLILRGRERSLKDFAKTKLEKMLEKINTLIEFKVEREIKQEPSGLNIIISKK